MGRKKTDKPMPWESMGEFSGGNGKRDTFSRIFESMKTSEAWFQLTAQQKVLYDCCKGQCFGEKYKPVSGDIRYFFMNQAKWCEKYRLYKPGNEKGFYRDMSALIEFGFIESAECGAPTRTKTIYFFSEMWKKYGTKEFKVPPAAMTLAARNRLRKKENEPTKE